ncbi:hypothetical protein DFH06DRAFT_1434754 [Mycena polygramma]|nr:hypothetical protein DFH06DRAFT_1434754 [Mycena polygramma]
MIHVSWYAQSSSPTRTGKPAHGVAMTTGKGPMNSLLGSGAVKLRVRICFRPSSFQLSSFSCQVVAIFLINPLSRRIFPSLLRLSLKLQRSPYFQYDLPASVQCGHCRISERSNPRRDFFFVCELHSSSHHTCTRTQSRTHLTRRIGTSDIRDGRTDASPFNPYLPASSSPFSYLGRARAVSSNTSRNEHPGVLPALLTTIKAKPVDFFHRTVRHLYLSCYSLDEGEAVLRASTGVVDLTVMVRFADDTDYLPLLARMPVQRLCARIEMLDHICPDVTQPAFASLTHLDVLDDLIDSMVKVCDQIPLLPALTHVAIDRKVPWDRVQDVLTRCLYLQLFVSLWAERRRDMYEAAKVPCLLDVRFVIGLYNPDTYATDWEGAPYGNPYFWSIVDDLVVRKKAGAVEATRYWLE